MCNVCALLSAYILVLLSGLLTRFLVGNFIAAQPSCTHGNFYLYMRRSAKRTNEPCDGTQKRNKNVNGIRGKFCFCRKTGDKVWMWRAKKKCGKMKAEKSLPEMKFE